MLLKVRSLFPENYWYWIGVGALIGYIIVFNVLFTIFLTYLNRKFLLLNLIYNPLKYPNSGPTSLYCDAFREEV